MIHPRRRLTPGIRLVVALVAALPMLGMVQLSIGAVNEARAEEAIVREVDNVADEVAGLVSLHAGVTTEMWWSNAVVLASSFGVPVEVVADVLGLDVVEKLDESRRAVDAQLELLRRPDVAARLDPLRERIGPSTGQDALLEYNELLEDLRADLMDGLERIGHTAGAASNSMAMNDSVVTLTYGAHLREQVSLITSSYLGTRYPSAAAASEPASDLIAARGAYAVYRNELAAVVEADQSLAGAWAAVESDPDVVGLLERVDADLAVLLEDGMPDDVTPARSPASIDLDGEAEFFLQSIGAVERHVDFTELAAEAAKKEADALHLAADATRDSTVTVVAVVAVLSILGIVISGRWIVRPLRELGEGVDRMRSGNLGHHVGIVGPREVQAAAAALNEATDHLKLAEDQALALAADRLDHPVLAMTTPGALGASLQKAVARLTESLAEQDAYRHRLAHEAAHDGLTGLANRNASILELGSALARVRRAGTDLAVMIIDLDGFKPVNERLGHAAGDRVLRTVAQRIAGAVRDGDHVGRLGADEFVVIAEPVRSMDEALEVAHRVQTAIVEPIDADDVPLMLSASIGVSVADDGDLTADELIRDADLAVFHAKVGGQGRVEVCDADLRAQLEHRAGIEQRLREAIAADELEMHYQCVTDARTRQTVSLEALVRWSPPGGPMMPPGDFIPIAERTDLIVELDRWVLRAVARQMATWTDHPDIGHLPVAVNLSARHLAAPTLISDVLDALNANRVAPGRLVLEITESAVLGDLDRAARRLTQLRSHGIRIAIDDFGTGYTSLSHLRRLPVDILKIDQSFVANLERADDRSLVKLIVETGHLLGVSVTAEGVETAAQSDILEGLGSDHLQGYRFSRPLGAAALESAMAELARAGSASTA